MKYSWRELSKRALHAIALLLLLNLMFFLSMALVFAIPNNDVRTNVERSMFLLDREGEYPRIFSSSSHSMLDSATDTLMIASALKGEDVGTFYAAMDMSDYARYWHGYQVILRPVLRFFNYHEIRVIQGTSLLLLLTYLLCALAKKGWGGGVEIALAFTFSLCVTNFFIVPISLQYANMHFLMALASIIALWAAERRWNTHRLCLVFLVIGAFAAFFDLLTTPLITLGMPLLLLLWQRAKKTDVMLRNELAFITATSITWGFGYGFTFAFKWVLATLVTGKDIIADGMNQLGFRMSGSGNSAFTISQVLMRNLRGILSLRLEETFFPLICGCILATLILAILLDRTALARVPRVLPMLLVGAFPYAWYCLLRNHSRIHNWFTFRVQMITVMAVACSLLYIVDIHACMTTIKRMIQKQSK